MPFLPYLSSILDFNCLSAAMGRHVPYVQNLGIAKDNVKVEGAFYPKLNTATQYKRCKTCTSCDSCYYTSITLKVHATLPFLDCFAALAMTGRRRHSAAMRKWSDFYYVIARRGDSRSNLVIARSGATWQSTVSPAR